MTGKPRILVLGGTQEAASLCRLLAERRGLDARVSLAGRTVAPKPLPLPTRIGGFGGADGLAAHLRDEGITHLVDATHPFAAQISDNAVIAAHAAGVPLLVLARPPWQREPGDRWTEVADNAGAVAALGSAPRRVFLTIGRLGIADFSVAPQHAYLIRSIDDPGDLSVFPRHRLVLDRGPYAADAEEALMRDEGIDVVVSKNSGGPATYGKIEAARRLGIEVVMVTPPARADVPTVHDPEAVLAWIDAS
ncbi:Precorrin-6A reductase [Hartmannibacter diazotrophicus]|uniref:Precorrin-6A reductase n=1 Tax=Hartmannibacter diazotrophicus TaxID=1482074 RepID=A0A2C9DBE9_9HYPH|nr:cobalt-precorrin-6A reductase [Hartmannibacter diazotrophicus]SON57499.1 Precorrin-6A reductase [Hartmannibacter diazotrophicus]